MIWSQIRIIILTNLAIRLIIINNSFIEFMRKKFFPSDIIKYLRNIKLKRECYRPHASMSD